VFTFPTIDVFQFGKQKDATPLCFASGFHDPHL
jgi:hypothetical protein